MERPSPHSRRVLVVDDDPALGAALRVRLERDGYDVEAVSLAAGLTAEFVERLAPGLVLLDAAAGRERLDEVGSIVLGLRERLGCRLLLVGEPGPALTSRAWELGADGVVDKGLLREPARVPPPLPARPTRQPDEASDAIRAMIDEELGRLRATAPPDTRPSYHAVVDLFSENNFYVAKTATGRLVGIFVATDLPPEVGTSVRLSIVLHGGRRIETRGEVAWRRERSPFSSRLSAGAGIRMLDLSEADKQAVRQFLVQRAPYSYTGG